jgi:uncharacterized SAM-binding protein YcdF (DUF218 family)
MMKKLLKSPTSIHYSTIAFIVCLALALLVMAFLGNPAFRTLDTHLNLDEIESLYFFAFLNPYFAHVPFFLIFIPVWLGFALLITTFILNKVFQGSHPKLIKGLGIATSVLFLVSAVMCFLSRLIFAEAYMEYNPGSTRSDVLKMIGLGAGPFLGGVTSILTALAVIYASFHPDQVYTIPQATNEEALMSASKEEAVIKEDTPTKTVEQPTTPEPVTPKEEEKPVEAPLLESMPEDPVAPLIHTYEEEPTPEPIPEREPVKASEPVSKKSPEQLAKMAADVKAYFDLYQQGIISKEEYESKKEQLLK